MLDEADERSAQRLPTGFVRHALVEGAGLEVLEQQVVPDGRRTAADQG
jgi:hypothetical protein